MKKDDILKSLGEIAPEYIASAARLEDEAKSPRRRWALPLAAVLGAALAVGLFFAVKGAIMKHEDKQAVNLTEAPTAEATAKPTEQSFTAVPTEAATAAPTEVPAAQPTSERQQRLINSAVAAANLPEVPHSYGGPNYFQYMIGLRQGAYHAGDSLGGFFGRTVKEFLLEGEAGENTAYSPLNVYMALAMLAETASGETRQQILDLIGARTMDELREQVDAVWLSNYHDNDIAISLPASSVWLNSAFAGRLNKDVIERLANSHHASVFEGDMDDPAYTELFRDWLNEQTRDLLTDSVSQRELKPIEILHIAATLYYKIGWADEFLEQNNTEETFHAPTGDETVAFMHGTADAYYEGEGYSMVFKALNENARVWFILPDEGVELERVISEGDALRVTVAGMDDDLDYSSIIHFNLPKFDVGSDLDLRDGLKRLGVTNCFEAVSADFSELTDIEGVYVSEVSHSVRVIVDEKGVEAAAIADLGECGGVPPQREIDFTLDRPFMFVITGFDGTPLFVGTVYHPVK